MDGAVTGVACRQVEPGQALDAVLAVHADGLHLDDVLVTGCAVDRVEPATVDPHVIEKATVIAGRREPVADTQQQVAGRRERGHDDDDALLRRIQAEPEPEISSSGDNRRAQELRTYGIGAQIIHDLGIRKMRVLSAPLKLTGLSGVGLEVVEYLEPGDCGQGRGRP